MTDTFLDQKSLTSSAQSRFDRMLFERLPIGLAVCDMEGRLAYINEAFAAIIGYSVNEALKLTYWEVTPKEFEAQEQEQLTSLRETGRYGPYEKKYIHKDGRHIPVRLSGVLIRDNDQDYIWSSVEDITAQKKMEEALHQSEERLSLHMENTPLGVISWDKDFNCIQWNPAAEKIFGFTPEEALGGNALKLLVPKEIHDQIDAIFEALLNQSGGGHSINENVTKDGRTILCEWFNTPLKGEDGVPAGVASIVRDVTSEKEQEKELQHAKEDAEKASLAKTRFLAAASHDLRQPVQAMGLFIHALENAEHDPDKLNVLGQLEESAHSLSALLNSLLDISRLDAGAMKVDTKPFKIAQVFSRLLEEYEDAAQSNNVQFDCVPCSLAINSDQTLIVTILRNLLSNAFMHSGTRRILLGCRRRPGGHAELQIWDTGKGIAKSHLNEIFNEFYQIDNEARRREKGLGLGLAIVKRVSGLLGHELTVRSQPGRGTVFSLKVPVAEAQAAQPNNIEDHGGVNRIEGLSIVIVEDEELVRNALTLVLENAGNTVLGVSDASSAENAARITALPAPPDIIIADYRLANNLTGVDAIRHIREVLDAQIPAFLLTGDTAPERIQETMRSGFPLVHKPVHPNELLGKIGEVLFTKDEDKMQTTALGHKQT